jgi:hypothetical protein
LQLPREDDVSLFQCLRYRRSRSLTLGGSRVDTDRAGRADAPNRSSKHKGRSGAYDIPAGSCARETTIRDRPPYPRTLLVLRPIHRWNNRRWGARIW